MMEQRFFDRLVAKLRSTEWQRRFFVTLRYLLPLLAVGAVFLLGIFYNIPAGKSGKLSLWRLMLNTAKVGREALLGGQLSGEMKGYYVMLMIGAAVALLAFLLALVFAAFAAYLYFVVMHTSSFEESKEAKILFRAVFPNRVALLLSNLLLLVPALYPTFFAVVSNRHPGGGFVTVGLHPILVLSLALSAFLTVFSLWLRRLEADSPLDMFTVEEENDGGEAEKEGNLL